MLILLILIILMVILPELRALFLIVTIITIVAMLFLFFWKRSNEEELSENANYKIGADVSNLFYDEVKQYCRKHHMTISDLIRKAVRAYMDTNR